MRKVLNIGAMACVMAMVVAIGASPLAAQEGAAFAGQITVNGTGTVALTPDMASVQLGVATMGETATAAMEANVRAMQAVMLRLQNIGIQGRDVQTSHLSLSPNWVQNDGMIAPTIAGYSANNTLMVRLRDLSNLGAVLDAAIQDGANSLDSLIFGHSNADEAMNKARIAAVVDARARAEVLVTAAGASLGRIVSISEGGGYDAPRPMLRMAAEASDIPVAPGEIETTANVTIVFEIQQ